MLVNFISWWLIFDRVSAFDHDSVVAVPNFASMEYPKSVKAARALSTFGLFFEPFFQGFSEFLEALWELL